MQNIQHAVFASWRRDFIDTRPIPRALPLLEGDSKYDISCRKPSTSPMLTQELGGTTVAPYLLPKTHEDHRHLLSPLKLHDLIFGAASTSG